MMGIMTPVRAWITRVAHRYCCCHTLSLSLFPLLYLSPSVTSALCWFRISRIFTQLAKNILIVCVGAGGLTVSFIWLKKGHKKPHNISIYTLYVCKSELAIYSINISYISWGRSQVSTADADWAVRVPG